MEILKQEENERYLLKLATKGAKLPPNLNIETLVAKEEETKKWQTVETNPKHARKNPSTHEG